MIGEDMHTFLVKLGLSSNETLIYLTLNNLGKCSINEVQKITKLPRTTLADNIDKLKAKGLIFTTFEGKMKKLVSEHPVILKTILDEQYLQVDKTKATLDALGDSILEIMETLSNKRSSSAKHIDIRYYRGVKDIDKVYDKILSNDEVRAYVNLDQISKHFPKNHIKFIEAVKAGMELWDLCSYNDRAIEVIEDYINLQSKLNVKKIKLKHHFKIFSEGYVLKQTDYLITKDSVNIITTENNVPEAIVIYSDIVATNARTTFDLLWSFLPEMPTKSKTNK